MEAYMCWSEDILLISIMKNILLHAYYDLWHARLGHVNHSIISLLNKEAQLYLTSLLLSPALCRIYQIVKGHRLPYSHNEHRSSQVLDLIHCDIWGPSPIKCTLGFVYYAFLLMTIPVSHSSILWNWNLVSLIFLYNVKNFLKINLFLISKIFKVMDVLNSPIISLKIIFVLWAFTISFHVPTHLLKMVVPNVNIAMWLRQA